ncbi:MAG: hypothetical protein HC838_02410 [Spirulinaceae cyanobacterium RM2_2_10]|nr:hypothetical protein [Spirulinaceae cyanobacterium SM2_1_0]NJO19142.1 hypothetical protein [Spirulinaceae cyanobacterium RM2_2_10]
MSNAATRAFFIGRALAAVAGEKVEEAVTEALSELGKFDAEQRENLRQFTMEVIARADRELAQYGSGGNGGGGHADATNPNDLQATIDDLRAEIAQLRSALHTRQSRSA